jgi:UDP-glucose 4-epimerase
VPSAQRVLVAGGAGFIGRRLVQALCAADYQVVVVGRSLAAANFFPPNARYAQGDISDRAFCRSVLADVDAVIDLAHSLVPGTPPSFEIPNFMGSIAANMVLLDEAAHRGVYRYLYVSSGGTVYGNAPVLPIPESAPLNPISPYGIAKVAVEQIGQHLFRSRQLPFIVARPSNPYGRSQGDRTQAMQGLIDVAIKRIKCGEEIVVYGDGNMERDYIHIDDLTSGLMDVFHQGELGEAYNIGTSCGTSINSAIALLSACAREHGLKAVISHRESRHADVETNAVSHQKLTNLSGWGPTINLANGIQRCFAGQEATRWAA